MTEWVTLYPQTSEPLREEVDLYVASPLWMELRAYLEKELHAASRVEYSRCGMEPGWNVKFKQGVNTAFFCCQNKISPQGLW